VEGASAVSAISCRAHIRNVGKGDNVKTRIVGPLLFIAAVGVSASLFLLKKSATTSSYNAAKQLVSSERTAVDTTESAASQALPVTPMRVSFEIARPVMSAVPARLQPILSPDTGLPYQSRMNASRELESPLTRDECGAIYAFLHQSAQEAGLRPQELNALKNHLVNIVKINSTDILSLIRHLMTLFYDTGQDPVWREYCVQHLGTLYVQAGIHQPALVKLFGDALRDKEGSLAGTALIALRLNRRNEPYTSRLVAEEAYVVASSAEYSSASRTTALQIAAAEDDPRIVQLARTVLRESTDVHLRVSALAVLGKMGDSTDVDGIEAHASSGDVRLRSAASAALKMLQSRS